MEKFQVWVYILITLGIAVSANSISAIWAAQENKFSYWFILLLVISPLVFITFGLVTTKLGLAVSSATIDTLLTVSTVIIGLVAFKEWNNVTFFQIIGMALAISGIILMQVYRA